jgi:hypothetical protein
MIECNARLARNKFEGNQGKVQSRETTKIQSNKIGGGSYEEKGCKLRAH